MTVVLGLRGKSALFLLLISLATLIPAGIIGWQAVDTIHRHFAEAYVENYTALHIQRILTPVSRELALSRRMADSLITRQWLADEQDPASRERFFTEAEGFRSDLADGAYFAVVHASGNYYFSNAAEPNRQQARYTLDPDNPDDAWYFRTSAAEAPYNININLDRTLGLTNVWFNVVVREQDRVLGIMGAGLELSGFLDAFLRAGVPGVTPVITDHQGAIQAHPATERIAFRSGAGGHDGAVDESQTIRGLLDNASDWQALREIMHRSRQQADQIGLLWASIGGQQQLIAVGHIPELDWHVITTLDLGVAQVFDSQWLWPLLMLLLLVLGVILLSVIYATDRLILAPLNKLKASAQAIAGGDYRSRLPTSRNDEIGELSRAFSTMAQQVENHTGELESRIRERTRALEQANSEMVQANKQISDSIQYAAIIQRAILPDAQLDQLLGHSYSLMWKPRDIVGGDFYIFRARDDGFLLGVVDCAGHGVAGSLMTMLARAIIDNAVPRVGDNDPAAILNEVDRQSRDMLHADQLSAGISTNMDIGLAWVDLAGQQLTFAGAKMALFASDGESIETLPGSKRAIGHRRPLSYENTTVPLHLGWTYCLCTDGFLDQAGGEHGFGFGNKRFRQLLIAHARRPLEQQMAAFEAALREYQGKLAQRDDITVLSFRFNGK